MQPGTPFTKPRHPINPGPAQFPLMTYLSEINETPLLNAEEEKQLARRIAEGDQEARDHMIRANLRLVVKIARSYTGKGLGLEDLIAEGNVGLLRAVEGFDPTLNTRFSTYAFYWIKQSIQMAVIKTGKAIRVLGLHEGVAGQMAPGQRQPPRRTGACPNSRGNRCPTKSVQQKAHNHPTSDQHLQRCAGT
jgi:RNA polymerase sigma factor (sigma-70 family)